MIRPKVGLDLDSCLNNLEVRWLELYNHDYKDNLTPADLLTWNTYEHVKPECGKKIYDYLLYPHLFRDLKPKPFTQEVVKWLIQYVDLYIVTAYHWQTCKDKVLFLQEHFPCIPVENVIFLNNKGLINLDYLVDDGPHNAEAFTGISVLMDMPYNQYLGDKYYRANDYSDVKNFFVKEFKRLGILGGLVE